MEDIVSADAIRREILEDARKKAARLLEEGEAEATRNVSETEEKAAEVVAEVFKENAAKSARYRMETMARFPLERTRMRTTFVDDRIREAASRFVEALPEARVASLAESILAAGADYFGGKDVELRRRGLSAEAAGAVASRALARAASLRLVEDGDLPAAGLMAVALDGSALLRATMDLVEERLLDERRGELAVALCGDALSIASPIDEDAEAAGRAP